MLVTFPNMGNYWVCFKSLFENLGFDVLVPPKITKKTIELGVKNAPETVCLPFKITLGTMIESLCAGAQAIAMISSSGPCRLGEYNRIQEMILKEKGYKFRMISFQQKNTQFKADNKTLYSQIKELLRIHNKSLYDFIKAFLIFYNKVRLIDKFAKIRNFNRAYETEKGSSEKLFDKILKELDKSNNILSLINLSNSYNHRFKSIKKHKKETIKLALIGEIFVASEPHINFDIEKLVGSFGIEIYNFSTLYEYLHIKRAFKFVRRLRGDLGNSYLRYPIGGSEGIRTITYIKKAAKRGYDGIIHLYPFTCMPEVTVKTLIPKISKDYKIPILSLNIDEQTGEAGFKTRIEAFIDMIINKKGLK